MKTKSHTSVTQPSAADHYVTTQGRNWSCSCGEQGEGFRNEDGAIEGGGWHLVQVMESLAGVA